MELKETIEKRISIREFLKEAVPVDDIREMVRLAGYAPSINNFQPWKFTLITNREILQKMSNIVIKTIDEIPPAPSRLASNIKSQTAWYSTFFENAPALLALSGEPYESLISKGVQLTEEEINAKRNYPDIQGVGACVQNLLLAAVDLGYGACWLAGPMFAREEIEKILNIQQPLKLMTFVAIGKPKGHLTAKPKRDLGKELEVLA